MDGFMNSFNASAGAFNRREADINAINQAGIENYNTQKAATTANYNALKGAVQASNSAVNTQTGIEEGFAGVGMEPLVKAGLDYGAKSLYAAGKQAKAARLGTRAEALQEGDTAGAAEAENPGMLEQASNVMDSELAQNVAAVAKAPGELIGQASRAVGRGVQAVGKAVYRGGQRAVQSVRGQANTQSQEAPEAPEAESRAPESGGAEDEAPEEFAENTTDDFDLLPSGLGDANQISRINTVFSTQGGKYTGTGDTAPEQELSGASSEQQGTLNLNRAVQSGEEMPTGESGLAEGEQLDQLAPMRAQMGARSGAGSGEASGSQASGESSELANAGDSAQAQADTLVSSTGQEVGSTGASAGSGAAESSAAAASATADADAAGAAADAATAATEAGIDAAAAASESVPGVGTVVGGLLALGGAIFGGIEGAKHHSSAPAKPPPPPKPTQLGVNIAEASPVLDSSIYRATGYNSLA